MELPEPSPGWAPGQAEQDQPSAAVLGRQHQALQMGGVETPTQPPVLGI